MDIEVWRHLRRYGKAVNGLLVPCGNPLAVQYAAGSLKGHHSLGIGTCGNEHLNLFSNLVGRLVRGEGEHGEGFGVTPVSPAAVFRPIHGEEAAAHVTGGPVFCKDEVSAPIGIVHAELDGGVLVLTHEGAAGDFLYGRSAYPGVQVTAAGAVPPPVPAGLVHGVLYAVAFHADAIGINHSQAQLMVLVRLQVVPFRYADAHIGTVWRERDCCCCKAFVAAAFLHASDDERLKHSGSVPSLRHLNRHAEVSGTGKPLLIQHIFCRCKRGRRSSEAVLLKALESGSGSLPEGHPGAGGALPCDASGQPSGLCGNVNRLPSLKQFLVFQGGSYLEAIRLYGFHVEGLVEAAGANLEVGVPVASGVLCAGGNIEGEESVLALADGLAVELAFRGINLQSCRMAVRQGVSLILDDCRYMQRISRPPDASLSVHKGFEAFLEHLSANVEAAQGAFSAEFKVCGAASGAANHGKGLMRHLHLCQAVPAGLCRCNLLQLIIVHLQRHAAHRPCSHKVRGRNPEVLPSGILRHKADVRGQQPDGRESVRIHVVGGFVRVIGLGPVVL